VLGLPSTNKKIRHNAGHVPVGGLHLMGPKPQVIGFKNDL
jgi:hypothetical protein